MAEAHGGRLSLRAFLRDTRIGLHEIVGKHWATWNQALAAAGIQTSTFTTSRTEEGLALEAFAQLVKRLRKWPTVSELLLQRRRDPAFPSEGVFRRLKKSGDFPARVRVFADRHGLHDVAAIAARQIEPVSAQASSVSLACSRVRLHDEVRQALQDRTYDLTASSSSGGESESSHAHALDPLDRDRRPCRD